MGAQYKIYGESGLKIPRIWRIDVSWSWELPDETEIRQIRGFFTPAYREKWTGAAILLCSLQGGVTAPCRRSVAVFVPPGGMGYAALRPERSVSRRRGG